TFWWESPSGNRIMVNRPEHYMWGNSLGILSNAETFGDGLFRHLQDITDKGYPFDHYAIQFSGYLTDNSPPSTTACSLVEQWNKMYIWPKLKLATISDFMEYMKRNHARELPVIRGAWPDWWMDGFGSAAIQTAQARKAHVDYIANQGLMSMAVILGIPSNQHLRDLQDQITDDLAFYDEHTFGAAESITDPLCENSVVQLGEKESYVWEAVKKNSILREEIMGRLQSFFPATGSPVITVINTLNWPRSGVVTVYIDHQIIPTDHKFKIIDIDGQEIPAQPVASREDGTYLALQVSDIPPLGFRTYRVQIENQPDKAPAVTKFTGVFEDNHYRIMVDTLAGKIRSIYDKELEQELTDPDPEYFTGDFIYERLGKNRAQLEHLRLEEYTRETWKSIRVSDIRNGPVWKSIIITGQMPGCADQSGIRCEIRLYKNEKKLEFCYSMKKLPVTDPEGVYVAFPFTLPGSELVYEVAGGTVVPGKDQVEGSASDWNGIQNFVAVRSRSHQIVFVSPEIPLVQLGDLNLGKFTRIGNLTSPIAYPLSPVIFSWVLNNYWTTNFLASQEGELKWTYQITSCRDTSIFFATRFGWSNRIPMLTRVSQGGKPESDLTPRSFLGLSTGNLLMVSIRPSDDGNGLIMQLREIAGKQDSIPVFDNRLSSLTLSMATGAISAWEVNVIGETVKKLWEKLPDIKADTQPVWMTFKPRETKFLELSFTRPKN
ncbi:MAG: glycoside hydrolase family 38 C-terminal domain-containing protein, partial [Bacteroidota bacterium]